MGDALPYVETAFVKLRRKIVRVALRTAVYARGAETVLVRGVRAARAAQTTVEGAPIFVAIVCVGLLRAARAAPTIVGAVLMYVEMAHVDL